MVHLYFNTLTVVTQLTHFIAIVSHVFHEDKIQSQLWLPDANRPFADK